MNQEQTFEQKQEELEAIVSKLENGNVPLEEMVALYEKGEKLYRECSEMLDRYEKRLAAFAEENA